MSSKTDVLIVGGGAIGVSCAWYLHQQGRSVTVIDKHHIGSGCSQGNAGLIVPSHVVPLAAPGVITQGIKWMFNASSPFSIKPRMSPRLWSWLAQFWGACSDRRMRGGIPVLHQLLQQSMGLFHELAHMEDFNLGLQEQGMLMVYKSPKGEDSCGHTAQLARQAGLTVEDLSGEQLRLKEPKLPSGTQGGIFFPTDAHLDPAQMVGNMRDHLAARGVTFEVGVAASGILRSGTRITGVVTDKGLFEAEEVVLAGGAWSGEIFKQVKLPVQPGKGYSITIDKSVDAPKLPMILAEAKVSVTPMGDKIRFGGTMELSGLDPSVNRRRAQGILGVAADLIDGFNPEEIPLHQIWSGYRPCTPDGLPIIGRYPEFSNLVVATGHAMIGISLAPITGQLVAGIIQGDTQEPWTEALKVARF